MFSLSFWFSYQSIPFSPIMFKIVGLSCAVLVVAGIVAFGYQMAVKTLSKELRHVFVRASGLGIIMGLAGLLMLAFVWEGIPFLSMRAFWILWLALAIWWGYWIYAKYQESLKKHYKSPEQQNYEKWLPKPKK